MKNLLKYHILDRQARPEGRATPKNVGPPKLNYVLTTSAISKKNY